MNQYLCGLQAINGWEGAWGQVISGLLCFALVCVGLGQVDLTQLRSKTTVTRHPQQSARH
ncbi:MAG: hypothetical protein KA084_00285 [Brachymonas sp.]|nr:hypothetical protein [Brachymonas sp.]